MACLLLGVLAGCSTPSRDAPSPSATPAQAATSAAPTNASASPRTSVTVTFERAPTLRVEVASTPEQRRTGLMNRSSVPAGTGMLFVFPAETTGGFWMKNTLVPLSIAYVRGDRVVSTAEMTPCPPAAAECPVYAAAGPYTAAVEAPAGFFPAHGVQAGTRMEVSGKTPPPR